MRSSRAIAIATASLAIITLSGCGDAARQEVRDVVAKMSDAARTKDEARFWACWSEGVLAARFELDRLGGDERMELEWYDLDVGDVTMGETTAEVAVEGEIEAILLKREGGRWVAWGTLEKGEEIDLEQSLRTALEMKRISREREE